MALDIYIEKVKSDGTKEEVVYFSGVMHVNDFYESRGLEANRDQHIDYDSVLELLSSLKSEQAIALDNNDARLIDKLEVAHERLEYAIANSIRVDDELIYHCSR